VQVQVVLQVLTQVATAMAAAVQAAPMVVPVLFQVQVVEPVAVGDQAGILEIMSLVAMVVPEEYELFTRVMLDNTQVHV
jgi:hypothetical protein